jgi:hypothetical protein
MIPGFEKYTHELTPEEIKWLPAIAKGLKRHKGKHQAITNKQMVKGLRAAGFETTGPRMRKMIRVIRLTGMVPRVIASSRGYYVAMNKPEYYKYIDGLKARANAIYSIAMALNTQIKTFDQ